MKNTLVLAVIITAGALSQAGADSTLSPRAQALFPHMAGHDQTVATSSGTTVGNTYAGTAARNQADKSIAASSRASDPDLVSRPAYSGRWPFGTQQRFEVAPMKNTGKECDANCTKPCCDKK